MATDIALCNSLLYQGYVDWRGLIIGTLITISDILACLMNANFLEQTTSEANSRLATQKISTSHRIRRLITVYKTAIHLFVF